MDESGLTAEGTGLFVHASARRAHVTLGPFLLVALGAAIWSLATTGSAAATAGQPFTVRSTLAGEAALPQRIRWLGVPSIAPSRIAEIDFLIDGKIRWKELHSPYSYGGDGNYLVTSWLTPRLHRFTVEAISTDRRRASTSTVRRVLLAPAPPANLTGSWTRIVTKADAAGAIESPPGRWRLTVDKVGWRFRDPSGYGAFVDVAYLSTGLIEARGGIATKLPASGTEGNVWCDEPYEAVRYRMTISGDTLTLTLAGPKRCDGQSNVWAGAWSRVGG